jgi:hypothetical protein
MTGAMAAPEPRNPNSPAAAPVDAPPAVSTEIAEIGAHVTGLTSVQAHQLPEWIQDLVAPKGWLTARVDNQPAVARAALFDPMAGASWTAAETISVFRFTGVPPADVLRAHNGRPWVTCTQTALHAAPTSRPCAARGTSPPSANAPGPMQHLPRRFTQDGRGVAHRAGHLRRSCTACASALGHRRTGPHGPRSLPDLSRYRWR